MEPTVLSLESLKEKDMILLLFDTLQIDFAFINFSILSEEYRSLFTKYDLSYDESLQAHIDKLVDTLWELNTGSE